MLSHEEIWKLINAPKNIKHRLVLMATYSAGLRAGEVAALKPEHIDSKRMLIKVGNLALAGFQGFKHNRNQMRCIKVRDMIGTKRWNRIEISSPTK